jgi:hypothetical protein
MWVSDVMTFEFFATYIVLHALETYMQVRPDWLMSSSKLQFFFELCQFAQALLKLDLQDEKCISLYRLARRSHL